MFLRGRITNDYPGGGAKSVMVIALRGTRAWSSPARNALTVTATLYTMVTMLAVCNNRPARVSLCRQVRRDEEAV